MAEQKVPWYKKFWDGTASGAIRRWLVYIVILNIVVLIWAPYANQKATDEPMYNTIAIITTVAFVGVGIISAIKENNKNG